MKSTNSASHNLPLITVHRVLEVSILSFSHCQSSEFLTFFRHATVLPHSQYQEMDETEASTSCFSGRSDNRNTGQTNGDRRGRNDRDPTIFLDIALLEELTSTPPLLSSVVRETSLLAMVPFQFPNQAARRRRLIADRSGSQELIIAILEEAMSILDNVDDQP
jgi:hypothetical protein